MIAKETGNVLSSQGRAQLLSPLECLTSVFGMSTGVSTPPSSPDPSLRVSLSKPNNSLTSDQVLDRLVSVNSTYRYASIPDLSTSSSSRGLTYLPRRLQGVLLLSYGRSHLGVGFALRCFQRLSFPCLATQLCRWHDNWCTSGRSIPVLSY